MFTLRKASDRGHFDHGWLDTWHSFSFAAYQDPAHMGFRGLRVINEDRILAGQGFGTHGHRDMEILTYVLEGTLQHRDSMGHGTLIRPGEVQRMSAGTGVRHSEFNASPAEPLHLLQIWILPDREGHEPGYEQKAFDREVREGRLVRVASPDGRDGSLTLHADVQVYAGTFGPGQAARCPLDPGRHAWVQVARGRIRVQGQDLQAGDGAAFSGEEALAFEALEAASEVLVFDLA